MPTDEGYDDPQNVLDSDFRGEYIEDLEAKQLEERIKDQYKKFEDLGNDLFLNSELKISNNNKADILKNLMVYVDKNYINISSIDSLDDNSNRLLTEGDYVYQFICVDSVSSLIPAFMEMIKAETIDDLDDMIVNKYSLRPVLFTQDFLKTIGLTIDQLMKLQVISPVVKNDQAYNKLLGKYLYYKELISFGEPGKFIDNFIRPVISKYSSSLIWKLF